MSTYVVATLLTQLVINLVLEATRATQHIVVSHPTIGCFEHQPTQFFCLRQTPHTLVVSWCPKHSWSFQSSLRSQYSASKVPYRGSAFQRVYPPKKILLAAVHHFCPTERKVVPTNSFWEKNFLPYTLMCIDTPFL